MDMINTFDFEGGTALARSAFAAAKNIQRLRTAFASADLPVIYCNDNFGQWRSDFHAVYDHCAAPGTRGARIASLLRPAPNDYFVLKPKHSAFYLTPLDLLVRSLEATTLVITGIAGDSCVMATTSDAHIREFESLVVSDAVASIRKKSNERVLAHIEEAKWAAVKSTRAVIRCLPTAEA
jgi:nicotinamidase-related amidase